MTIADSRTRTSGRVAIALLATMVVLITSCSGKKNEKATPTSTEPKVVNTIPPGCEDDVRSAQAAALDGSDQAADAGTADADDSGESKDEATDNKPATDESEAGQIPLTRSVECGQAVFLASIESSGSDVLKKTDEDQLLGYGHGICSYSRSIAENPLLAPSYKELIASTADSWGVDESVVEEVINHANELCPGQLEPLQEMKKNVGSVDVHLAVTGEPPFLITYTSPGGDAMQQEIDVTPWEHQVTFQAPADVTLTASSESGSVTCTVMVNDKELVRQEAADGEEADCSVSGAQVHEAAR